MAEIVQNCPRCGSQKTTFDVLYSKVVGTYNKGPKIIEVHSSCRACGKGTIFLAHQTKFGVGYETLYDQGLHKQTANVGGLIQVQTFVSVKDQNVAEPPQHLPPNIDAAFREGATCLTTQCFNAAGAMFRLCIDLATKPLLPATDEDGLNNKIRRSLGLRLEWLFKTNRLSNALRDLSEAVKDDGNDGAHEGTLGQKDVLDLQDFAFVLLERLYTEDARLRLAKERRDARKDGAG